MGWNGWTRKSAGGNKWFTSSRIWESMYRLIEQCWGNRWKMDIRAQILGYVRWLAVAKNERVSSPNDGARGFTDEEGAITDFFVVLKRTWNTGAKLRYVAKAPWHVGSLTTWSLCLGKSLSSGDFPDLLTKYVESQVSAFYQRENLHNNLGLTQMRLVGMDVFSSIWFIEENVEIMEKVYEDLIKMK